MRRRNKDTSKMLLTVSSFGESRRRTYKSGGGIFIRFLSVCKGFYGSIAGKTTMKVEPCPGIDSTQTRP